MKRRPHEGRALTNSELTQILVLLSDLAYARNWGKTETEYYVTEKLKSLTDLYGHLRISNTVADMREDKE